MSSGPVEFLKIEDWTNAFYDGVIWTHKKIDEMDGCLEEIRQIHTESLAVPGLQRPPKWRELGENVVKFNTLRNAVVGLVNTAFDALNTCWENNDENYTYKYMEAKPLRRRFEKTAEAFAAQHRTFHEKAREKVAKHLADQIPGGVARRSRDEDNSSQQKHVTCDHPTSSTAVNSGLNTGSELLPSAMTNNDCVPTGTKGDKSAAYYEVDGRQSVKKQTKPSPNTPKEEKPSSKGFVCDVCAKKLGSMQGLNDHKRDSHGVPVKPPPNAPEHVVDEYHRQLAIYCQQQMDKLQMS